MISAILGSLLLYGLTGRSWELCEYWVLGIMRVRLISGIVITIYLANVNWPNGTSVNDSLSSLYVTRTAR